jgi:peptidyl-prolyl cis-trans isomerase SurA
MPLQSTYTSTFKSNPKTWQAKVMPCPKTVIVTIALIVACVVLHSQRAIANAASSSPSQAPAKAAPLPPKDVIVGPNGGGTPKDTKTASRGPSGSGSGSQSIVALVNDEPITGYEIQQRAAILGGGNINAKAQANFQALIKSPKTTERLKAILAETIKANQGKSKDEIIAIFDAKKKAFGASLQKQAVDSARSEASPAVRKSAIEELIDEKLKLQEAKRQNVVIAEDEVTRIITGIMERNKLTEAEFARQLGGSLDPMKTRIRTTLSWNEVVRRRYGSQVAITTREVDKFVAANSAAAEDQVELQVQRIRIALPAKIDQTVIAKRMQDAENIRAKFKDCKSSGSIATGVPGAKFEDLGKRRPSAIAEPTRSLLLTASDGEMLPPSVGDVGIELWMVCGRDVVKGEDQKRNQAEGELKQKEFEVLAKRALKDLRQDAHIEYR